MFGKGETSQVNDLANLIATAQAGGRTGLDAFNELVLTHQQQVYNLAYRMVNDADLAADVTQDTFTSAFQSIGSFRGGSFKAWLLRIASNCCYDHFRRRKRRPTDSLDNMLESGGSEAVFTDSGIGPEERALQTEMLSYIQRGLSLLPEEQRLVIVLSDVQGFSYEEIAEITGSSLGTVKSRLSRGRARLRDFLVAQRELLPTRLRPEYREQNVSNEAENEAKKDKARKELSR